MEKEKMLPTIKIYEVDYSFIIENYLDKSLWDKNWTLFQYKYTTATLCLDKIDTRRKIIIFEIRVDYSDGEEEKDYYTTHLEFQLGVMNVEQLKNLINNCIWNNILNIEGLLIRNSVEYLKIQDSWYQEKERLEEIAKDFLDSEGVTNSDIRDAYIDKFVDDNDTLWKQLNNCCEEMRYTILTELFLVFARSINDEKREQIVINNQKNDIKILLNEVSEYNIYIETEEFTDKKRELLPNI